MTALTFTVKKQTITIEVPDGFEVVVAGNKVSVRQQAITVSPLPWAYYPVSVPYVTQPYTTPSVTVPYTPPYGTLTCSGFNQLSNSVTE